MAFLDLLWSGISYLFTLLGSWLSLFFLAPFQNVEVLWILIPIWLNLIVTDFYQEKHGTTIGNAITNGVTMLWVGIDWIRFTLRNYTSWEWIIILKILLCLSAIAFGLFIVIKGVQGKPIVHLLGRVRETSYLMLVISPVIYNIIPPSASYFLSILLFFPLFYLVFELIDRSLPDPKAFQEDQQNPLDAQNLKL